MVMAARSRRSGGTENCYKPAQLIESTAETKWLRESFSPFRNRQKAACGRAMKTVVITSQKGMQRKDTTVTAHLAVTDP